MDSLFCPCLTLFCFQYNSITDAIIMESGCAMSLLNIAMAPYSSQNKCQSPTEQPSLCIIGPCVIPNISFPSTLSPYSPVPFWPSLFEDFNQLVTFTKAFQDHCTGNCAPVLLLWEFASWDMGLLGQLAGSNVLLCQHRHSRLMSKGWAPKTKGSHLIYPCKQVTEAKSNI
jgi:hypothetical protein